MYNIEAHLKNIISANNANSLAIFVGAGVSKSSNNESVTLPSWGELIDALKLDLEVTNESDYTKLAQLYFLEFNEPTYYKKIKEFIPEYIEPSDIHRLIFSIRPQCIITTNWDNILERTVENEGLHYETVCSDKDLVKCVGNKKIIKMHGDFKNHNIVFKEDDYLNYSHNFPLIENYVKNILSTHTILFLGYSYSDINLKHIMKWIQNHSSYCPPMYLATFDNSESQKKYLESHGITSLILDEKENCHPAEPKTASLEAFLKDIKNGISNQESEFSEKDATSYIYEKIQHLAGLRFVTLDDIKASLPYCSFEHTESRPIIDLLTGINYAEDEKYQKEQKAYNKFISMIKSYSSIEIYEKDYFKKNNFKLFKILDIFSKARIIGIATAKESNGDITYFENDLSLSTAEQESLDRKLLSFKSFIKNPEESIFVILSQAYSLYEIGRFSEAYELTLKSISLCKKQKNYSQLLISMFNKNALLNLLRRSIYTTDQEKKDESVDLQDEFFQLPKQQLKGLQHLYDFLSFKTLHEKFYQTSMNIQERSKKDTIFFKNNDEFYVNHIDLLLFPIHNNIMIEHYRDYKSVHENHIKLLMLTKPKDKEIVLNLYEIYTLIKIPKKEFLKSIFENFVTRDEELRKKIKVSSDDLDWAINSALPNIIKKITTSLTDEHTLDNQLSNLIFLLSIINLDQANTEKVLAEFSKLTKSKTHAIHSYEAINLFFTNQYHLYSNNMPPRILLAIIEDIINKIVNENPNSFEIRALTSGNGMRNIYHYVLIQEETFSNEQLVNKLLLKLSGLSTDDKIRFAESIILNIYNISSEKIRAHIKKFILGIKVQETKYEHVKCRFEIWRITTGFKRATIASVKNLEHYLENRKSENSFSTDFYSLKEMIDYLVNTKGEMMYEGAQKSLEIAILSYEKFKSRIL